VHRRAQPGGGQGCKAWGTAGDGDGGAARTAGAGRQRRRVGEGAVEGAEGAEGPGGSGAATSERRWLAGAGDEVEETEKSSGEGVKVRGRSTFFRMFLQHAGQHVKRTFAHIHVESYAHIT
jgi:hypothetical protein